MNHVDFLAEVCLDRRVLDLRPGCSREDVERRLGPGYLDVPDKKRRWVRRDYGLLEFSFFREHDWACRTISVQVHRLAAGRPDIVPPPIRERYGPFPDRIGFDSLAPRLGGTLPPPDDSSAGYTRYALPGAEIFTVRDPGPRAGDIWSVVLTTPPAPAAGSDPR